MPLDISEIVGERYRVVKLLGQGGMGAVYRAWDLRLNRAVALKEMIPQSDLDVSMLAQLRQQFKQEAQVLATLVHPSLVRVTDYFSWENNEYLVMDFVEGESLAARIEREGAQPETQVLTCTGQLLDALAYCHERGVIHRDIKPQNIIITPDEQAVLVDFGLVKLWDPRDPRTRTVMRGAGTPEYAPPEQYDMGLGHTDPRSDIYGLGATIYHALTGQAPPTATQRMASPASFAPPRRVNAAVSPATEAVVLKALEMAMERRYQSAGEMAQALETAPRLAPIAPRRVTREGTLVLPTAEARPAPRGKPGLWIGLAIAGALCLILVAGGGAITYFMGRPPSTPVPAAVQPSATASPTPTQHPVSTSTPYPTNTPRPTDTPHPTDTPTPETGGTLFQDDFGDSGSGWEVEDYEGGSIGYKDGVYFIRGEDKGYYYFGVAGRSFADTVIEVDATQITAPANDNNHYGVGCRIQSNNHGYFFRLSGDGYYAILKEMGEEDEWLVDWTQSTAIHQGNETNHIRAVCDGDYLALFVNGELLAEAEDSAFNEGDIGLAAGTFEDEPTEIHFDNLVVRRPMAILFQDDFSDLGSGWEVGDYTGGSVGYKDGIYFVRGEEDGSMMWGVLNRSFDDLVIEVDATQVSAPDNDNNAYGVKCREQADGDGYGLIISGDGYYSIQIVVDGDWNPLVAWTTSDVIHQGNAANHIRAVCDGTHLALSVNGELLAEIEDSTYTGGDIALAATTFEDTPTEVHFDDLVVSAP
ncbi:MAG: protein kinase [Anaerolineae bacterium]